MSARTRFFAGGVRGRTHRSAPTRYGVVFRNQRGLAQDGTSSTGAGRSPPPTGDRRRSRRGAPGVWLPPAKFRNEIWGVGHGHRPLRPAGGRGTARRVVVPYGWLRRAAAIALGSGAQRSVCASGCKGWVGIAVETIPKRGQQRRTIPQSRRSRDSSCCT